MMRRFFVSALIAVAASVMLPGVAGAHALLKSSVPAAGADLKEAPHQILLTFTEPPDPTLSLVTLVTSSGATVDTGKAQAVPGARTRVRAGPSRRAVRTLLPSGLALAAVGLVGSYAAEAHAIGASLTALAKTSTARPDEFLGAAIVVLAVIVAALARRDTRGFW